MFGAGSDRALVWFCDPSDVGWIFTISNFFVAIGISSDEVKAAADYVTTSVDEDGIMNALKHFGVL